MSTEVDAVDVGRLSIGDGRLRVAVAEGVTGADEVDLDLSDVESFHFERSGVVRDEGALVVVTADGRHVIPLKLEDAPAVVEALRPADQEGALGFGDATPQPQDAITGDRDIVDGDFAVAGDDLDDEDDEIPGPRFINEG